MGKWAEAAEDGRQCIVTDKSFVKGYFRAALAHQALGNLEAASDAVKRGLGIDSTSADLKRMSKEIDEAARMKKVDAMIAQAEKQLAASDVTGAYKTLDNALRLDPTNSMLNRMMDKVRPKYEMAEKHRMASLDPKERLKEEGDTLFKAANFEGAIKAYTKCLDSISDKVSTSAQMHWYFCSHSLQCCFSYHKLVESVGAKVLWKPCCLLQAIIQL